MIKYPKYFYIIFFVVISSAFLGSLINFDKKNLSSQNEQYPDIPSLPASLDAYYPPNSEQPVYMFAMLEMENPFSGIIVDLMEQDFENANKSFEKFREKYVSVSKMVPEWEANIPMAPVEELGKSMQSNDIGKIMASIEAVGNVCGSCHGKYMVIVQQKYHWKDFESVSVTDQVTKENTSFARLMQNISVNFSGMSVNLQEGQIDNAKTQFEQFKSRFLSMRATCTHCHKTPRKYYVDENIQSLVDELGKALGESKVDSKLVGDLSMKIGYENCFKCHLVHMPAAVTKRTWKMQDQK